MNTGKEWDQDEIDDDVVLCDLCGKPDCHCDECGLMADGQCTLAGTEFCDFECTFRD